MLLWLQNMGLGGSEAPPPAVVIEPGQLWYWRTTTTQLNAEQLVTLLNRRMKDLEGLLARYDKRLRSLEP